MPDRGLTEAGLEARRAKEAARMEDLRRTIPRITSLAALHRWLFTEHRAYAAGPLLRATRPGRSAGQLIRGTLLDFASAAIRCQGHAGCLEQRRDGEAEPVTAQCEELVLERLLPPAASRYRRL
jgi:hypothetical protein